MHVLIARQSITRDAVPGTQLYAHTSYSCLDRTGASVRRRGTSVDILPTFFSSSFSSFSVFKGVKIARLPDQELPALCNNSHYESLRSRMHRTSVGNRPLRRWCGERGAGAATKLTYRY